MLLKKEHKESLRNADVDAACSFSLKDLAAEEHYDRFALCKSLFRDKSVIHLGCCDHVGLIDDKIRNKVWMHGEISKVSRRCIGFDIDQAAVDYVAKTHKIENVHVADLTKTLPQEVSEFDHWDFLFLGEVIEHIGSPVHFLQNLRSILQNRVESIVLTCPNGFRYQNFTASLCHYEYINSDHRYWFSPFTISKVLEDSGFTVESIFLVSGYPVVRPSIKKIIKGHFGFRSFLRYVTLSKYPLLRDSLLVVARFS
jgi:hypothetical protein